MQGAAWTLLRPDGTREALLATDGVVRIGAADQIGRYQVVDAQDGTARASFEVNLLDPLESELAPRPVPRLPVRASAPPPHAALELRGPSAYRIPVFPVGSGCAGRCAAACRVFPRHSRHDARIRRAGGA